jgi:hypothetical protein
MVDKSPDQISLSDLREVVRLVLDAVEEQFGSTIDLDADHYWSLDPVESFDLTRDPRVTAGQISEDVEDTRGVLTREEGEIYLWHDIAHLAAIFTRISALDSRRNPRAD